MRLFEKLKSTFGKKTKNQLEIENAPLVDSEIPKGEEENGLVNYDTNFIPLPKYASLPEKLNQEKISLFTLMEYLEWEEFIVHRYGPVRKDDIITILVNACSDLYIGDKGKALLALIAYEALDKRFSFSKEWSLIEMQSQTETAFFPRLLCGLENRGKGDFLVFVPIRYFNKRTKKLLIHEHFETDGTDLSNVLQYIPNVEEN